MSKALLIIDMPENCENCRFLQDDACSINNYHIECCKYIPKWCPLTPLSMKRLDDILRVTTNPNELYKIGL